MTITIDLTETEAQLLTNFALLDPQELLNNERRELGTGANAASAYPFAFGFLAAMHANLCPTIARIAAKADAEKANNQVQTSAPTAPKNP